MENNPGDSSSESDISDPWSIIDRDSCEPEEIPGDSSVRDRDSISGEPSDGESLEVIDEEEKHEDEYKDAEVETDGISIITESEGNDELEQSLPLSVSKEKKYLHHPNTYLNTRLNVLLAISFAAVTGLGLGHFLGLQEECPLLNESTTMLLTKLQNDNRLLRYEIEKLLSEKDTVSNSFKEIQDCGCGAGTKFKNEGTSHLHPSLQTDIPKNPLHWEGNTIGSRQHTTDNRNQYAGDAKQPPVGGVGRVSYGESSGYIIPIKHGAENVAKQPSVGKEGNILFDESSEYEILDDHEDAPVGMNVLVLDIGSPRFNVLDFNNHVDDLTFVQFRGHDDVAKSHFEFSEDGNMADSPILVKKYEHVANSAFVMKNEWNFAESSVKDDKIAQPRDQVKDVFAFSATDGDAFLDGTTNTHSSGEHSFSESTVHEMSNHAHMQQHEEREEGLKETHAWEEKNMEIIKTTLKLLQAQFDDDIVSPDTGNILSSSIALATELEQSLVYLQDTIIQCEVQESDFCAQFQKRMKVSVSKLKDTTEGLVDDIDEQMYKLLTRIVRKLKKYKGNLQDKWCHVTNKYDGENDAIYNWLHSAVLLECKESARETRRKWNQFSSKEPGKLQAKDNKILKIGTTDKEYDGFKNVDLNVASETDQKSSDQYTLLQTEYRPESQVFQSHNDKEHVSDKDIMNHDNLNEQHFKMNTPMVVPEAFENPTGQEQYMTDLYKDWKHDDRDLYKTHYSGKEKKDHENKHKNVLQSKTCWQTYKGKKVCQKFSNDHQFLHSQKFKDQYIKRGRGDNHWYEKKNWKNQFNDKDNREYKKQESKHSWQNGNKHHKQSVILEQDASWVLVDTITPRQNNVSGDWILRMANARAEQRKLEHKSDWLFDRADARKLKRERHHVAGNWYFQRAHGREYCRYYPNSDWCKTGTYNGPNYDWLHQTDHRNGHSDGGRLRHAPRWSKKIHTRSFASAGKWMKDTFSNFQNKINYHSHR